MTRPVRRCGHVLLNDDKTVSCKLSPGHRHCDHTSWEPDRKTVTWTADGRVVTSTHPLWVAGLSYTAMPSEEELRIREDLSS